MIFSRRCVRRAAPSGRDASGSSGVAPTADAGPDASHNRFYGSAYTLAGSATGDGPITYEWSKVSGTPVPTFVDDTDPETDVTFDVAGAVTLRLTATNAFGLNSDDVVITVTEAGLLDGFAAAPLAAWGTERLLAAYATASPLYKVRKTTGGDTVTTQDIASAAATDLDDTGALATFVGAQSWAHTQWFDQCAGARPLSQAVGAAQPVGGTTGTPVAISSRRAADFDGAAQFLTRGDSLGMSGAQSVSAHVRFQLDAGFPYAQIFLSIGTLAATQLINIVSTNATTIGVGISGSNRLFTAPTLTSGTHSVFVIYTGGSGIGTVRLWLNGTELVELSSLNPSNTLNMGTAGCSLANNTTGGTSFTNCRLSRVAVWSAALSGADITKGAALS